jgi:hypothetical protein
MCRAYAFRAQRARTTWLVVQAPLVPAADLLEHHYHRGQYMKVGLVITPPVLLAVLAALELWLPVVSVS